MSMKASVEVSSVKAFMEASVGVVSVEASVKVASVEAFMAASVEVASVEASVEVFMEILVEVASMEASVEFASVEASVESFMEVSVEVASVEAFMEASTAWKCGSFHGSFHELPPKFTWCRWPCEHPCVSFLLVLNLSHLFFIVLPECALFCIFSLIAFPRVYTRVRSLRSARLRRRRRARVATATWQ